MEKFIPIPQPKTFGPLGNLPLVDKEAPTLSFCKLAEEYGPIFRMEFYGGFSTIFLSGHELVAEACNESKFDKSLTGGLSKVRAFSGDGLFTSKTKEPNWQKAHNILVPSFSQQAMKGYHSMMVDIAFQLVQKWARLNPNESIDVSDDMTRLTLDTIGICGFNYRFNSFYRENHHPFITNMANSLDEAMHQGTRLPIQNKWMLKRKRQFEQDIQAMFSLVDELIAERKKHGDQGETDMLARMLSAMDPETGEKLSDENIRFQIITFLIAGHETTSGLLSFTHYLLLKHPDVLKKAYEEVDQILTSPIPTYKQVTELKYIRMILNESLRLYPTAPQFTLFAKEDTVLGGKYPIKQKQNVAILLPQLHRDKAAWGDDAEEFRPERFEDPSKIPHDAYKPFGNGQRACIGMQFALHEAALLMGMILQNFELIDHTNYQLKIKQTMTLKPDNFTMRVQLRDKKIIDPFPASSKEMVQSGMKKINLVQNSTIMGVNKRPLLVLYGSNMGTAEGIARDLAERASGHGIRSEVAALDERINSLPTEGAVLIVTSSYNGKPPKNARKFVQWLEQLEPDSLKGVHYSVFGCGDRNWANTYQDVPRFIDEQLAIKGATRFSHRGEADVSMDIEKQLEEWKKSMWSDAMEAFGLTLVDKDELKRSILTMHYVSHTDDFFGGLPSNSRENVNRILRRFSLNGNDQVILSGQSSSHLPLDRPIGLYELLIENVDLQAVATRSQIRELADLTVCPPHKRELELLLEEGNYEEQILRNNISMLDLLEKYEACEMTFERYLELLPPLKLMAEIV
ncbi:cytochrome P450 [Bacillus sp. sid0103]|nr:cytochrome P450 [Bacillus sp. sid0103]